MFVYVQNQHGHPLMPCEPGKARRLLKTGKADVVKRTPFTIRLRYGSAGYTQPVILGVDAGSKTIGLSAATKTTEVFRAEVHPRSDVVKHLSTRREFRRARRNRKTRYRMARFENRVRSKHKGWLAPSVEVKIQEHISAIRMVCRLLPVTKVVVETAEFDLQKLKALEAGLPAPEGEDYQKGEMLGFYHVRQYVLWRDGYTCQCCDAHGENVKLHAHHLESRKEGGNAPGNLVTLCKDCHEKVHKGKLSEADLKTYQRRRKRSTRDAAFMGIMRKTLLQRLREEFDIPIWETHGYVTKYTRVEWLRLEKSHTNDALAITQGRDGFQDRVRDIKRKSDCYTIKPVRHHNRQIHKATILKGGVRKSNQQSRYVHGYRLFDKVRYQGTECFIWGRRKTGSFLLKRLDGTTIKDGVSYKKIQLLERSSNYLVERTGGCVVPPHV